MDQCCDCRKSRKRSDEELRRLCNRLSRIEGQVRGLREMLGKDVYCTDILVQVSAVSAALIASISGGPGSPPAAAPP